MINEKLYLKSPMMRGDSVFALQNALTEFGYKLSIDGIFGAQTKEIVVQFQKDRGLTVDGIVGPQTWAALEQKPEQKDYVKLLIKWGFENSIKTIGEKPTIKQFQSAMGLSVDGVVGPQTLKALNSEIIIPRLTQEDLICQCTVWYKDNPLCNGYPAGYGAGQGILILAERIFRRYEELYGKAIFYISSIAHDPSGYNGGWKGQIAGGNRCAKWATQRGSTITSRHVRGDAMDIWGVQDGVSKATVRSRLEKIALSMNISGGVGYGAAYIVHIDNRGVKARWRY